MPAPDTGTSTSSANLVSISTRSLLLMMIDICESVLVSGGCNLLTIVDEVTLAQTEDTSDASNVASLTQTNEAVLSAPSVMAKRPLTRLLTRTRFCQEAATPWRMCGATCGRLQINNAKTSHKATTLWTMCGQLQVNQAKTTTPWTMYGTMCGQLRINHS